MIHTTFERDPAGRTLRGDVRLPDGPPPRSAVVLAHGFKGFKDRGFFPWLAHRLVADRHAVVTFNFSGSGIGPHAGERTEPELFATGTFSRDLDELAWIVDAVRTGDLLPLRPRRTGLVGHGRGGALAVVLAAETDALDALVTWAAPAALDRWSDETLRAWREEGRIHVLDELSGRHLPLDAIILEDFEANRERLDPAGAAARVRAPWSIVHGLDDRVVPPEDARLLARAAEGARLHLVEGGGHHFGPAGAEATGDPTPEALREAERVTRAHLLRHLRPG